MQPTPLLLSLLSIVALASAATGFLQNPDFESPPSNLAANSTVPFVHLSENNTIPGWTFEGLVQYATAGQTVSLQGNGHAIQLGQDGRINQTFIANAVDIDYIITFTLAPGGQNCTANADIAVSGPNSYAVFSLKQHYGKEAWESYGHYLGNSVEEGEPINLVFESVTNESDSNSTCWPVIDAILLNTNGTVAQVNGNLVLNGGFEFGPKFVTDSTEGILLDSAPSPVQSPLQQWAVVGTVKYIDSTHYFVPQGNAAIEIISGVSTGLQTATDLIEGSKYSLEFMLGDANDSCVGDFIVGAQAGSIFQNFTLPSNGTGSAKKFSMTFTAGRDSLTLISFRSYTISQTKNGVFCGPVIDDVVLHVSNGLKLKMQWMLLISLFLLAIL